MYTRRIIGKMEVIMWQDYIVDEIRKNREQILIENNYDLTKLRVFQEQGLKELKRNGWKIITKEQVLKQRQIEKSWNAI